MGNTPSQGGFHHPPGQGGQSNSPPMVIGRPQIPNENSEARVSPERNPLRLSDDSVDAPRFRNPLAMMGNGGSDGANKSSSRNSSFTNKQQQKPLLSPSSNSNSNFSSDTIQRRPIPKPPRKMDGALVPLIRPPLPPPPPIHFEEPEEFSMDSLAVDTASSVRTDDISPSSLSPAEESHRPPNAFSTTTTNNSSRQLQPSYKTSRRKLSKDDQVDNFPRTSNLGMIYRGSSMSTDTFEESIHAYDSLNEKSESDPISSSSLVSSELPPNSLSANSSASSQASFCDSIVQVASPVDNIVTVNGLPIIIETKKGEDEERQLEIQQNHHQQLSLESQSSFNNNKSFESFYEEISNGTIKESSNGNRNSSSEANSDSINPDSLSSPYSHSSGFISEGDGLDFNKMEPSKKNVFSKSSSSSSSSIVPMSEATSLVSNKTKKTSISGESEVESANNNNERCELQQVQAFDCGSAQETTTGIHTVKNQTMKDNREMGMMVASKESTTTTTTNKSVELKEPFNSQIERNGNNVCIIQINGEFNCNEKPQSNCLINKEIKLEDNSGMMMPAKQEDDKDGSTNKKESTEGCYNIGNRSSHQQNHRPLSDHTNILCLGLGDKQEYNISKNKETNYQDLKDKVVISSLTFIRGKEGSQREDDSDEIFTQISLQSEDGLSSIEMELPNDEPQKLSHRDVMKEKDMAFSNECDRSHRKILNTAGSSTSSASEVSSFGMNSDSGESSEDSTTLNEYKNNSKPVVIMRDNNRQGRKKLKDIMISPSLDEFESLEAEVSKFESSNNMESSMKTPPFKEVLFGSNFMKSSPTGSQANSNKSSSKVALVDEMFVTQGQRRGAKEVCDETSSPYYTIERQRLLMHSAQDREIQEECINFHKEAITSATGAAAEDMSGNDASSSVFSDKDEIMSCTSSMQVNESTLDESSSVVTSNSGECNNKSSEEELKSVMKLETFFSDFSKNTSDESNKDHESLNSLVSATTSDSSRNIKVQSSLNEQKSNDDMSMTITESSSAETCLALKHSEQESVNLKELGSQSTLKVAVEDSSNVVEAKSTDDNKKVSHVSTVYMCDESPAVIEMGVPFPTSTRKRSQEPDKDFDLASNIANCNSSPSGTLTSLVSEDDTSSPLDSLEPKHVKEDRQPLMTSKESGFANENSSSSSDTCNDGSDGKHNNQRNSSSPPKSKNGDKKVSKNAGFKKPWLARRSRGSITDAFPEVEICESSKKSSALEITDLELFQPKEEISSKPLGNQSHLNHTEETVKVPVGDIKELLESKECEQESRPVKKFEEKKQFLSIAHWGEVKVVDPVEASDAHEVFSEEDLEIEQFEIPAKIPTVTPVLVSPVNLKNEIPSSLSARLVEHSLHSKAADPLPQSKRSFVPNVGKHVESANSTPSNSSNECSLVILPKDRKSTTDGILQELKRKEGSHRHHHHHHHRSGGCKMSSGHHHHGKHTCHGATLDKNFELLHPTRNFGCSRVTETIFEGNDQLKLGDINHELTSSGSCEPPNLSGRRKEPGFGDTYRKSKSRCLTLEGNQVDQEHPKVKFLCTGDNSGNIMSPSLSNNFMDMNGTDNHKDNEDSSTSATPEENFSRQLQEKENYINELQSNLEELKLKANSETSYTRVLSEYEKTLSMYVQKVDDLKGKLDVAELEKRELIQERDQALEDLRNVESAFSDVHRKYERSKTLLESMKSNEETMIQRDQEMVQKLHLQDKRIETLKEKAQESLDQMYQDYEGKIKELEGENIRLRAQFRKMEMKLDSLENDVEQKAKENAKLSALCDELIHGQVNN